MGGKSKKSHRHQRSRSRSPERKSKKHADRSRDSSRSRSSSSDSRTEGDRTKKDQGRRGPDPEHGSSVVMAKRLGDIESLREERRREKELVKSLETPEEKRARRLAKKEAKERKRKMKMGWDNETLGYTNDDNPFGDEALLETFVWERKLQKEGRTVEKDEVLKMQKEKMEENRRELEKVKRRRIEREREREEREREREMEQRDKESEYYNAWEKQEDTFHLQQAKMRSKIRIDDGRAKPIDLLAKYVSADDNDMSVEVHEPYTYLNGLTIDDLEDLLEDIKVYTELEQGRNQDYWRDITTVTEDELGRLRKMDPTTQELYVRDRREGIHHAVNSEVAGVFKGKSLAQLQLLGEQIRKKLRSAATGDDGGGGAVDVGYWESLLQQLAAHMARTRLRERHQDLLKQKLARLKQEQGIDADVDDGRQDAPGPTAVASAVFARPAVPDRPPVAVKVEPPAPEPRPAGAAAGAAVAAAAAPAADDAPTDADLGVVGGSEDAGPAAAEDEFDPYDVAKYSPRLLNASELEEGILVYNAEEDVQRLDYLRRQMKTTGRAQTDTDGEYIKKAREGMSSDEAQFSVQVPIERQAFMWSDKYRPRKPRFFNRVHTGFEWNKYNQTHYDMDNPPPKIVQGYKFNIFYPDLIDKTQTPEYSITPIEEEPEFCVLRFHAGPPYEDIAFKVVNREWEHSYKRGFKCQFHNNIFQLWYHFKRYRYRR